LSRRRSRFGDALVAAVALAEVQDVSLAIAETWPAGGPPDSTIYVLSSRHASSFEIVRPSASGEVTVYSVHGARVSLRLRGYYTSGAATTAGSTYVPMAPTRYVTNEVIPAGGNRTITVAGANGVPAAARIAAVAPARRRSPAV
jgi:hypothetical protein